MSRHSNLSGQRGLLLAFALVAVIGCDSGLPTDYGSSNGFTARRSVNGFTTFRNAFETAGFYGRDVNRLTDRARSVSAFVWTPGHPAGIEFQTTRWFDRWLASGDKTLIYVIPDSGSETAFYRDARPLATPEQRLEYRRKYAERLIAEHQWQLLRSPIPSNGWFAANPKVQRTKVELADQALAETGWQVPQETAEARQFEWVLEPADPSNKSQQAQTTWRPVGPGSPPVSFGDSVAPTTTPIEFEPIFSSKRGDTLVARVTSKNWDGSQILVIAGGSLLTNYGLTRPENQLLADQLIASSLKPLIDGKRLDPRTGLLVDGSEPQVGFSSVSGPLPVSERVGEIPRATGAELLTEFPMSFVTMHLAVIGFMICLVLMPIFGRPRQVDRRVLTHFGDHLNAVATLMRRRGGESYARRRISDYMQQVREETTGPWVLEPPSHPPAPGIHLHLPPPRSPEQAPEGLAPEGLAPEGLAPEGLAPEGLAPAVPERPARTDTSVKQSPEMTNEAPHPSDRG